MAGRLPNEDGFFGETARLGKGIYKDMIGQGRILRKSRELFLSRAKETRYTALPGPSWTRLLKIEAGPSSSVVYCSLRQVDLDRQPKYTALSYTWREDHTKSSFAYAAAKSVLRPEEELDDCARSLVYSKEIVCDGKVIKIYPNLYNALVQLRQKSSGEYWIDALCINQKYGKAILHLLPRRQDHDIY